MFGRIIFFTYLCLILCGRDRDVLQAHLWRQKIIYYMLIFSISIPVDCH